MSTKALNHFSTLDNSIRPNIILNCSDIIPYFNEEDMKCIDYNDINCNHPNLKFDCNVILSVQNNSKDTQKLCFESIQMFDPVFYCTINSNSDIHNLLLKSNYSFICKTYLLYIYKK
jgi:hypothetical protein